MGEFLHCWIKYESLFSPGGASVPFPSARILFEAGDVWEGLAGVQGSPITSFWSHPHLGAQTCHFSDRRLNLEHVSFASGGSQLIGRYVTSQQLFPKTISSFQQLMSEINQISWVIRKILLLRGMFSPLVVIFTFSLSAVSSFIVITYYSARRGV